MAPAEGGYACFFYYCDSATRFPPFAVTSVVTPACNRERRIRVAIPEAAEKRVVSRINCSRHEQFNREHLPGLLAVENMTCQTMSSNRVAATTIVETTIPDRAKSTVLRMCRPQPRRAGTFILGRRTAPHRTHAADGDETTAQHRRNENRVSRLQYRV